MKDKWLQYVEQKGELLLYVWAKLYKGWVRVDWRKGFGKELTSGWGDGYLEISHSFLLVTWSPVYSFIQGYFSLRKSLFNWYSVDFVHNHTGIVSDSLT